MSHPRSRLRFGLLIALLIFGGLPSRSFAGSVIVLGAFDGADGAHPVGNVALDANGNLFGTAPGGGAYGNGTVFEIVNGSRTITPLVSFDGANGDQPSSGVVLDSSGNLYGTTYYGGTNNSGTVWEIISGSNTITTLASFNGTTDGANPAVGPLALDANGNLYGTTNAGGLNGQGTVFEVVKGSNTITTLASFNGTTNGSGSFSGLTMDAHGNLFGTTSSGGSHGLGTVFEIARGSNMITTLASFDGINGAYPRGNVTVDSNGNLFGIAQSNGNNGGTVWEIANGSKTITVLVTFNGTNGAYPAAGLTLDPNGNLFGTTTGAILPDSSTVFEIAKGSNTATLLATLQDLRGYSPDGGMALDPQGHLFGTSYAGGSNGFGTVWEYGTNLVAVPEPSSLAMAFTSLALVGASIMIKRRHQSASQLTLRAPAAYC